MKKKLKKTGILFLIFLLGVVGFSCLMNNKKTDNRIDLEVASIPCMAMKIGSREINRMYGYTAEMEDAYMRDSLTPVDADGVLKVSVTPNGQKIKSLVYEVKTLKDNKSVEKGKTTKFRKEEDGKKTAQITMKKPILKDQEYSLVLILSTETESWNYYTRIIRRDKNDADKYVDFVNDFYKKTFDKENKGELAAYLEPDSSAGNNSFNHLNIHSDMNMVTWGNLEPEISRLGIPCIKDINENTGSISLNYYITAENDLGEVERYQVDEFYRMRYDQTRVRLLDFERSAKRVLTAEQNIVADGRLNLGITDSNVKYRADDNGSIIAFVQQGDLWSYNLATNKMIRIFSFRDTGANDERNDHSQYDIDLIRVNENGDVDFIVYGYMNRGDHEGKTGTAVYHYSAEQGVTEEKFFLLSSKSYEFLKEQIKELSYVSEDNHLYLVIESTLYQINMTDKSYKVLEENIESDCFKVSRTGRYAAWMEGMDRNHTTEIVYMDLETAQQQKIQAEEGSKIRLFGFINNDIIYGTAKDEDILWNDSGTTDFGMSEIKIQNHKGELVKEYHRDGYYVLDVILQENLLELPRALKQGNTYVRTNSDQILNNVKNKQDENFSVITMTLERPANVTAIQYALTDSGQAPLVVEAKFLESLKNNMLDMPVKEDGKEEYYVYAKGRLWGIFEKASEAVITADEQAGIVLDKEQKYIWERGNRKEMARINPDDIPEEMKQAEMDIFGLREALEGKGKIVSLTGCTLDQVLYELSASRPVVTKGEDGQPQVLVGFDGYNTILYNPVTEETFYMGMQDSTALFSANGNVFMCFIENGV